MEKKAKENAIGILNPNKLSSCTIESVTWEFDIEKKQPFLLYTVICYIKYSNSEFYLYFRKYEHCDDYHFDLLSINPRSDLSYGYSVLNFSQPEILESPIIQIFGQNVFKKIRLSILTEQSIPVKPKICSLCFRPEGRESLYCTGNHNNRVLGSNPCIELFK